MTGGFVGTALANIDYWRADLGDDKEGPIYAVKSDLFTR